MKARPGTRLFDSWLMGGFECSTHRTLAGRRLDLVHSSRHEEFAEADYARLRSLGMYAARDGIRWHLVEQRQGEYSFNTVVPMIRAARKAGITVIWDVFHYGFPDDVDLFSAEFVDRLAGFAAAFARVLDGETDQIPFVVPVNEISFFAWAAAEQGFFAPYLSGRADELKKQLVRGAIAVIEAMWDVNARTRILHTDPAIHVVASRPEDEPGARAHRQAQFHGWDMIGGYLHPELGGRREYLDVIGPNYYVHNQWVYPGGHGTMIEPTHPQYRPMSQLLLDLYRRYQRPLLLAETGIEDEARPRWLRYVGREVRDAIRAGVPVQGVCLYPIVNHPGWDDDRHCHNGLWDYADDEGHREPYAPLADEARRQEVLFERLADGLVEELDEFEQGELRLGVAAHRMEEVSAARDHLDVAHGK